MGVLGHHLVTKFGEKNIFLYLNNNSFIYLIYYNLFIYLFILVLYDIACVINKSNFYKMVSKPMISVQYIILVLDDSNRKG